MGGGASSYPAGRTAAWPLTTRHGSQRCRWLPAHDRSRTLVVPYRLSLPVPACCAGRGARHHVSPNRLRGSVLVLSPLGSSRVLISLMATAMILITDRRSICLRPTAASPSHDALLGQAPPWLAVIGEQNKTPGIARGSIFTHCWSHRINLTIYSAP